MQKNVCDNFPIALTFSQQQRNQTFRPPPNCKFEPCPQTYNPSYNIIKEKQPQIKISKTNFIDVNFKNLIGPCDYNPKKLELQKQISFSKQFKEVSQQQKQQQCAQYYSVDQKFKQKIQYKFLMGERDNQCVIKQQVGPGSYFEECPSSFSQSNIKSVKGSFSQQKRFHNIDYKNQKGPLDYFTHDNQFQKMPEYSMQGKNYKKNVEINEIGPGQYDINIFQPKFAKSIGIKLEQNKKQHDVGIFILKKGPGQYNIEFNDDRNFKIKTSQRKPIDFGKNDIVSSQSYELNYSLKNQKSCVFSSQDYQKLFDKYLQEKGKLPGPVTYRSEECDIKYKNLKAFFFNFKFSIPKQMKCLQKYKENKPGPQSYNIKKDYKGIQYTFSKAKDQQIQQTPGPGDYKSKSQELTQSFSIPKQGIILKQIQPNIGPGEYNIQSNIGLLPSYQKKRLDNHNLSESKDLSKY